MKKQRKKSKKKNKYKKKILKLKFSRKLKKVPKKKKKNLKKRKTKNLKIKKKKASYLKIKSNYNDSFIYRIVKLQISLKPRFNLNINFNLEKHIQGFFDKISQTIANYKILKYDEKRRLKLEKIENERK